MAKQAAQHSRQRIESQPGAPTPDIFTAMVGGGSPCLCQGPRPTGTDRPVAAGSCRSKLRREFAHSLETAPGSPRRAPRARAGHWSYDLNHHLGLMSAYKGGLARLNRTGRGGVSEPTSAADKPQNSVTPGQSPSVPSRQAVACQSKECGPRPPRLRKGASASRT
jgi:hypothetical protein